MVVVRATVMPHTTIPYAIFKRQIVAIIITSLKLISKERVVTAEQMSPERIFRANCEVQSVVVRQSRFAGDYCSLKAQLSRCSETPKVSNLFPHTLYTCFKHIRCNG